MHPSNASPEEGVMPNFFKVVPIEVQISLAKEV